MKKISRIRWLTTLMGLVVLMFTCAGCGQTAAQSNVPKPDASQSRVRIYESMVELEDDSPLIITGEISRTSVIRDIDDITDFTLLDVKVSQTLKEPSTVAALLYVRLVPRSRGARRLCCRPVTWSCCFLRRPICLENSHLSTM